MVCSERAAAEHLDKEEVIKFMSQRDMNCEWLFYEFVNGTYPRLLKYRKLKVVNPNGKTRNIDAPDFITRIYQYVFLELIEPIYYEKDPNTGLNCKPGHGITADEKKNSVIKQLKHLYYDCREYEYALITDQRQCYAHMKIKYFRRMLRRLVKDERFVDFAVEVCYVDGHLPVGTPTSPMIHHIMMLGFDLWINSCVPDAIRYADDLFVPCRDKEEAQRMKWRIKNAWWYELGIRAKRGTTRIVPMRLPSDFCGYIPHRNESKKVSDHNKGYVTLRNNTFEKACRATNKNWGSYFGILVHADLFAEMCRIEKDMDLKRLTEKIRINRAMDAPSIMPKELADKGIVFTVYDYEIRKDSKGVPNWIKCLIGYPEVNADGEETGRIIAREFHGGYMNIIDFHLLLEQNYPKREILPLTGCEIENSCGYIYKNSTNQIKFIDHD